MRRSKDLGLLGLIATLGLGCEGSSDDADPTATPTAFRSSQVLRNGWNIDNGIFQIGNGIFQIGNGIFQIGNGIFQIGNGSTIAYDEGLASSVLEPGVLEDEDKHKFVRYLVECALDQGDAIALDGHTFEGALGLAPGWATDPLEDPAEQQWVSACMLARVNTNGDSVPLAFLAEHPNIGMDLVGGYSLPEAAFYGNFFTSPPEFYHCQMPGGHESAVFANHRTCGSSDSECGFTWMGECAEVCSMGGPDYTGDGVGDIPFDCLGGGKRFESIGVMLNDDAPETWSYLGEQNLSTGMPAQQSTTWRRYEASRAVDGDPEGALHRGSVSHTLPERRPWWQVDLGSTQCVTGIRIHGSTDRGGEGLGGAQILTSDGRAWRTLGELEDASQAAWSLPLPPTNARWLALRFDDLRRARPLVLAEVDVMGSEGPCGEAYLVFGTKNLHPAHGRLDLCVAASVGRRGSSAEQRRCTSHDGGRQDWEIHRLRSGDYEIRNVGTDRCLSTMDRADAGAELGLAPCDAGSDQHFEFVALEDGDYAIFSARTGLAVSVDHPAVRPGAALVQAVWEDGEHQRFSVDTAASHAWFHPRRGHR